VGITGGRREKEERGVRLGVTSGIKGSGVLHESQTPEGGMKKKLPEGM
jgi:hypothetical protein